VPALPEVRLPPLQASAQGEMFRRPMMEYLFCIWAIVYIVFQLPVPPAGGTGYAKLIVGLVGIILLILVLLGMMPRHG
jgi:hypothetical protein